MVRKRQRSWRLGSRRRGLDDRPSAVKHSGLNNTVDLVLNDILCRVFGDASFYAALRERQKINLA